MARLLEKRQRRSAFAVLFLALSLGLHLGCARSEPLHRNDSGLPAGTKSLPFHSDTDQASSDDGASDPAAPDPKRASSLPFRAVRHPRVLPAGTLLTVQLENSLSAAKVRAGEEFNASVAAPLTIDHETLVQRGTAVTGRIESVRSLPDHSGLIPGYFRLTLSTITVEGKQLTLQTASLFARGTVQPLASVGVRKGHRLTFRLIASVALDEPNSTAKRQSLSPATE